MRCKLRDAHVVNPDEDTRVGVLILDTARGAGCCYAAAEPLVAALMDIKRRLGEWRGAQADVQLDSHRRLLRLTVAGFTLIECMVTVAVVAILATLAVPLVESKLLREQVAQAMEVEQFVEQRVVKAARTAGTLPNSNEEAGLADPADFKTAVVRSIAIGPNGLIVVTLEGHPKLKGQTIATGMIFDAATGGMFSVCGYQSVPAFAAGNGSISDALPATTVNRLLLPVKCRA